LALLSAFVSAGVSERIFERIPHVEDEFANLWQAEVMAQGQLDLPSPDNPKIFLVPFVVDFEGRRFGKYPPGWPATLSIGARLEAPWLVNAVLAGLAVWLVYRLGTKVAGRLAGLLAALLVGSSPMFVMLAGSLMSHILSLALACAFSLAWLDLFLIDGREVEPEPVPPWLLVTVAGFALGLLVLTRPLTACAIALPFAIHGIYILFRGEAAARRRALAVAGLTLMLSLLLLLWQAALTGDALKNLYTLWWEYDRLGFGLGRGHTETGHNLYLARINTRFSLRAGQHDLFGWPYLSWLFLPFGLIALRRNRAGWLLFSIAPILVLIYAAYWIGAWLFGPRYYFEALLTLSITSAAGIEWLGGWGMRVKHFPRLRGFATVALIMLLFCLNIFFYLPIRVGGMHGLFGIKRESMQTLQESDLGNALVIVHAKRWMQYGALLPLTSPFVESDLLLAWTNIPERIDELLIDYADRPIYHYYPDEPDKLYPLPRENMDNHIP
jgi:4-amino-4-deoxy-L-arabinose transferase-like glycosyltransferase